MRRELNFIDEAMSPECKVLATSRFGQMLSGYTELALGLLSADTAVELLLATGEVGAPSSEQLVAAKTIAELCGGLPLYITMVGRLIAELVGSGAQPWETEVPVILQQNRSALFAADRQGPGRTR